jgi:hypothetical protein
VALAAPEAAELEVRQVLAALEVTWGKRVVLAQPEVVLIQQFMEQEQVVAQVQQGQLDL